MLPHSVYFLNPEGLNIPQEIIFPAGYDAFTRKQQMTDIRVEKLAHVLVEYSLRIKQGDVLVISAETVAEPLVREVVRLAARKGAHPVLRLTLPGIDEILMKESPDAALDWVSPFRAHEVEQMNAQLSIWADTNTQSMSSVPPARVARRQKAYHKLGRRFMQRAMQADPEVRWCGTLFPTNAQAQDAKLSLSDYEDFVYHAMRLDTPDPVQAWRDFSAEQERLRVILSQQDEIHVVAEDTDIRVRTKGRIWVNADGQMNFPDGEIFTGPHETSANGHIRYTFPTIYDGREAEDVHLWFEAGRVVRWEARRGKDLLDELFAMDEGARLLGEFAIGNNFNVPSFTKNILFDEKIGGTCHLAVGASIPMTGGTVQSALHWDMVCDLRRGGAIYGDGELLQENGVWKV